MSRHDPAYQLGSISKGEVCFDERSRRFALPQGAAIAVDRRMVAWSSMALCVADGHEVELVDGDVALVLDLRTYRLAAIKKAAYRCAARFTAIIGSPDHDQVPVTLRFKPSVLPSLARESTRQFFQELLDQELREHIAEETNAVRTLILAHAFSNVDLIKRGE